MDMDIDFDLNGLLFADDNDDDQLDFSMTGLETVLASSAVRKDTPLAGILEPKYQDVDPRIYFPDFKPRGPLRFSRMMGSNPKILEQNMLWSQCRTFCKNVDERGMSKKGELQLNIGQIFTKEQCVRDQTDLLLKSEWEILQADEDVEPPPWRFGPAQIWYDRLKVPIDVNSFDYGFKLSDPIVSEQPPSNELLPVNLLHWEDDIIMDSQDYMNHEEIPQSYSFLPDIFGPTSSHSIFPADNYELEHTRWEDDVILDPDNMSAIPKPRVLTIAYEDDPTLFNAPDDYGKRRFATRNTDKKSSQFTRKSKIVLNQVQRRQKQEEEEMDDQTGQNAVKDVFNMSNDEYYVPKNVHRAIGTGSAVQHSNPAQTIDYILFPTHVDANSLRQLYRLPPPEKVMELLVRHEILIQNVRSSSDGGDNTDLFRMRTLKDLSARDGTLVCIEYSEEHPPLLSQPGMASKIRNYHQRKGQKEVDKRFEFGETAFAMKSPFLGNINDGQSLQAIENNMYRSPIFQHKAPFTDFILIRCADGLFLRECPAVFVAGQECPLYEVPAPSSKKATAFVRDSIMMFIYRLFSKSEHQPRRLNMKDIREAFPDNTESSIRKRLKLCADYTRSSDPGQNYWALRDDVRMPSDEEIFAMVTPEMFCANYSMRAAEQRLKDSGYGDKNVLAPEKTEDADDQVSIESEVKCAPWNTTSSYISALNGKCILDQTGIADPTGCGQGFSYVRVTQKARQINTPKAPKRTVTGTNADLRKLSLKDAKEICRSYGIREEEINSLTRWEVIDVIRTLSTQAARTNMEVDGMERFARGRLSMSLADAQDGYKKYCQRIFDLQNKVLASANQSENSDTERASKFEEEEESDRLALQLMLHGDGKKTPELPVESNAIRKLVIHRVFTDADGVESERVEIVANQRVVEGYDKVRTTKDAEFIKTYAVMDDEYKEECRKRKRRLQDKVRREKRKEQKAKDEANGLIAPRPKKTPSAKKPIKVSVLKIKCGACGQSGHMRTNKNCPLYAQRIAEKQKKKDAELNEETVGDVCKILI